MIARRRGKGRGGKGGHEPQTRLRLREAQVLEHLLDGRTQHQIAEALSISQPAVSKIVRRVEERLLADLAYKAERQRARQTLRLEHIYGQAMHAWQDSKQELRRRQRKTEHDGGTGSTVAELISENRHGDPRYLDEARKALTDMRKLWGIDAPERASIDLSTRYASMSDDALEAELVRKVRLLQPSAPEIDAAPESPESQGVGSDETQAVTVNRETSALSRMFQLAIRREQLERMPLFPKRLEENSPRDGFFEHAEYLKVRALLPKSFQDVLDFAYYSGWRRNEILELTWDEVDMKGGVIRLPPRRSKTRTGRVLPISPPLQQVLKRRRRPQQAQNGRVFSRDGVPVREWRTALRDACRKAKIPHRLLHDCRRTAARNLIRAGVPERIAMLLTGHKTRAVFDRYNIVNEQELLTAGERLAAYVGKSGS